jgi:hypothetical protein
LDDFLLNINCQNSEYMSKWMYYYIHFYM